MVLWYGEQIPEPVFSLLYTTPIIVIVIMSVALTKVYKKTKQFYYAYLLLAIAFTFHGIAEITWLLLDMVGINGYQSYPDIFYALYGIFLIFHPWLIMNHFKIKPKKISYFILIACVVIGNLIYVILSWDYINTDTFLYGLGFVTLTNFLLGSSIVAIITLRGTKIHKIWILICIAFVINASSDIYYYATENYTDWTQGDIVNITWFITYIILIFALIEPHLTYSIRKNGR